MFFLYLLKFKNQKKMEIKNSYTQKINFARIIYIKNYSELNDMSKKSSNFDDLMNYTDVIDASSVLKDSDNGSYMSYVLPENNGRNTRYFYADETSLYLRLKLFYERVDGYNIITTTDDDIIRKAIGNPFAIISIYTIERSVTVFDTKVSIKYYFYLKSKCFNSRFFIKKPYKKIVTLDTKFGNIYTVTKERKKQVKTVVVKKNSFININEHITNIFKINIPNFILNNQSLSGEVEKIFDDDKFYSYLIAIFDDLNHYLPFSSNNNTTKQSDIYDRICQFFLVKKNIKAPNDYLYWLNALYPTENFLKKNERKLIQSSLDMIGLKNKFNIKLFHKYNDLDILNYHTFVTNFGSDYTKYFGNLKDIVFQGNENTKSDNALTTLGLKHNNTKTSGAYVFNDMEKENIIKYINDHGLGYFTNANINLFYDHIGMLKKINKHGINLKFNAKTTKDFHEEHLELSKIISAINKGWVTEYVFNNKMVEDIELELMFKIDPPENTENKESIILTFYPYILKREEEYQEEGKFMHHCVATYSDKVKSVIISIRNKDMSDRVTCEFNAQDGALVQARHFCNKTPPSDMFLAIEKLIEKTKKYARLGMLHALEHKKVPIKINGVEIIKQTPSESKFTYSNLEPFF